GIMGGMLRERDEGGALAGMQWRRFFLREGALWDKVIAMATRNTAEEHLRIIRSLMEKATIYRAISVPTALVGGCAGILASAFFHFACHAGESRAAGSHLFLGCWLTALVIAG